MQIVIEIDEEDYAESLYKKQHSPREMEWADNVIANGTPIPDNATVCDIDAIREEITEMIEREEVYHTKDARAQIIALEWALDVIESHTNGKESDK